MIEAATAPDGERDLPWSSDAEQSLLGSLLQDNAAMAVVSDLVDAASFFAWHHRAVFDAIATLSAAGRRADPVTVAELLQADETAREEISLDFLRALELCVPSSRHAREYAAIVAERCTERSLLAGADEMRKLAGDGRMPLDDRMESIAAVLRRVEQQRKAPAGRRVPMLSLDALRKQSEAVRWVVKHVIPAESTGMLFGGSGTFKSFLALDAALHVAHGLPWLGRKTAPGAVLYIAAEGGAGLWARIDAWHRARNLSPAGIQFYVVPAALDLTADAWRVVDAAQMVGVTPALVVVDTLSQTYAGEENSAGEMAAYLREIGVRFRALWACACLLVHHTGHNATERPRGSSAIRANLDFLFAVWRDEKEMLATLSCTKQKDGELFDDCTFSLSVVQLGVDEDNDRLTSLVARHLGTEAEVDQAMQAEAQAGRVGRNQALLQCVRNLMTERELRTAFYELVSIDDPDARRKAYQRAKAWALSRRVIEFQGNVVLDRRPS